MSDSLLTVAASTCISPSAAAPLFGRKERSGPWTTVETALEANLVALRGTRGWIVLVGLDTLFAGDALSNAVRDRLGPAAREALEEIVFVATHTHNAPALDPTKPALGRLDAGYFDEVAGRIAAALDQLCPERGDAVFARRGRATCELNAIRRRRGLRIEKRPPFVVWTTNMVPLQNSVVPRELVAFIGADGAGRPCWVIWSWCCHATSAPEPYEISADFPGHVRTALRAHLGRDDLPIIFLPGFSGDVQPDPSVLPLSWKSLVSFPFQRPFARRTRDNFGRLCHEVSNAAREAVDSATRVPLSTSARAVRGRLPLTALLDGEADGNLTVAALSAGELRLFLVSAEVCSPYIGICRASLGTEWLLSGCAEQVFGYLPTDRQIAEGGYEADEFRRAFSLAGRFWHTIEPNVAAEVATTVDTLRTSEWAPSDMEQTP